MKTGKVENGEITLFRGPDGFRQQTVSGTLSSPACSRQGPRKPLCPVRPHPHQATQVAHASRHPTGPGQGLPLAQLSRCRAPSRSPAPSRALSLCASQPRAPSHFPHPRPRAPSCYRPTLPVPHRASGRPLHRPPHEPRVSSEEPSTPRHKAHHAPSVAAASPIMLRARPHAPCVPITCPAKLCVPPPRAGHTPPPSGSPLRVRHQLTAPPPRAPSHTAGPHAVPHHGLRDTFISSFTLPAFPPRAPIKLRASGSRALSPSVLSYIWSRAPSCAGESPPCAQTRLSRPHGRW